MSLSETFNINTSAGETRISLDWRSRKEFNVKRHTLVEISEKWTEVKGIIYNVINVPMGLF